MLSRLVGESGYGSGSRWRPFPSPELPEAAALYFRLGSFIMIRLLSTNTIALVLGQNQGSNTVVRADAALPAEWPSVGVDLDLQAQEATLVIDGIAVAQAQVDASLIGAPTVAVGIHGPGPAQVYFDNVFVEQF